LTLTKPQMLGAPAKSGQALFSPLS
jgi:hypothetical protein